MKELIFEDENKNQFSYSIDPRFNFSDDLLPI